MLPTTLFSDFSLLSHVSLRLNRPGTTASESALPAVGSSYSLNHGNIKGMVAVIDGKRVHYEERVKLFGGSQQLTLIDRHGSRLSYHFQHHHWVNTRA
ncbi:hypothetical protein [Thioalkalivibrio sulfidiphilus]|uniref:hypothetical protein n=1 Tax=Thioalkalivibrio sulfidiphilus TaxID=1033854 RepID=UPI000361FBA5|nr:hypothetical protein [Thioalkalivibrio sulfidiphilus]